MTLPEGTFLSAMSYASDGVPGTSQGSYVTVSEHHGVGYELEDGTVMFQFSECQNWSVAHPAQPMSYPGQPSPRTEAPATDTISSWVPALTPVAFSSGGSSSGEPLLFPYQFVAFEPPSTATGNWTPEVQVPVVPQQFDPPPLPTPLPGAALFLLSALVALGLFARRRVSAG